MDQFFIVIVFQQGVMKFICIPFKKVTRHEIRKCSIARFSFNDFDSTPEKFKLVVFTLKTYHMFSVHTSLEKFENGTSIDDFKFVFEENSCG